MRGRIVLRMTRARTASYGVVTPPPLDRWIDAVLMLFASLVQGVAATFGMRFNCRDRDWHTGSVREALPQTKPDIHLKENIPPTDLSIRVPGGGRDPASAQRAISTRTRTPVIPAEARKREGREPRSHAHLRLPPLGSGSRFRASGMTRSMCVKISPI